jgi:AcrR family transcriptional regulator
MKTDPRAVRSRQAMIGAAVRLLQRGGVEAVTHQAVATESGVGRATVYRHWPTLTDLLLDALADAAPVVDFGDGDLRSQLLHEFQLRLPTINSPIAMSVIGVLVGRGEHDDQVHDLRAQIFGGLVDAISEVIAAAAEDGQLTAGAPAHELSVMLLGSLLLERAMLGREITAEHLEQVVDAVLHGWWRTP